MAISKRELAQAERRMAEQRASGYAVEACYDRENQSINVRLHTGVTVNLPIASIRALAGATQEAVAEIEISPSGLGLHWPRLEVDLYLPSLIDEQIGNFPGTVR